MNTPTINKKYLFSAAILVAVCAFAAAAGASPVSGNDFVTGTALRAPGADGRESLVPAGTMVTILGNSTDGTMVHFGVDSDDESVPSEMWVKITDVAGMNLNLQEVMNDSEGGFSDQGTVGSLEDAGHVRHRGGPKRGGMTYCYRFVKEYLLSHHLVRTYLPGGSAYMAAKILPKYGFHRVNETPAHAKLNDLCVYHGGRGDNGHVEVKVAGGWYYGYGVIPHPIHNHPFLGCFRKN